MDDWLKPNQEKRIIENCVESVMDDLDHYHFDEKFTISDQPDRVEVTKQTIDNLEKIKETLS